jgi:hypothetical protein
MADNLNHLDSSVIFHMIQKKLHLEADITSTYFTKTKYLNDFSAIFSKDEIKSKKDKFNAYGRLDRESLK